MDIRFWARDARGPQINRNILDMIKALYNTNGATAYLRIVAVAPTAFNDRNTYVFLPATSWYCDTMFIAWEGGVAIFMDGTNGGQIPNFIVGIGEYQEANSNYGADPAFQTAAVNLLADLPVNFLAGQRQFFICGHSYGGAIAIVLARMIRALYEPRNLDVITYGSPRPGTLTFQRACSGINYVRWFCDNDPVPHVPPHQSECPTWHYLATRDLHDDANASVQPPEGHQINAQGIPILTEESTGQPQSIAWGITAWLTREQCFGSAAHQIDYYRDRFALFDLNIVPPIPPITRPRPEQPELLRPREQLQLQEQAVQQLDATSLPRQFIMVPPLPLELPAPPTISPVVNPLPGHARYHRVRHGRVWTVDYQGETICVARDKKAAKVLARNFNRAAGL